MSGVRSLPLAPSVKAAAIAQVGRASAFQADGCRFEACSPLHYKGDKMKELFVKIITNPEGALVLMIISFLIGLLIGLIWGFLIGTP